MSDNHMPPETLIEFPCHFPIKVMGEVHDEFTSTVIEIIKQKNGSFDPSTIEMKGSSKVVISVLHALFMLQTSRN